MIAATIVKEVLPASLPDDILILILYTMAQSILTVQVQYFRIQHERHGQRLIMILLSEECMRRAPVTTVFLLIRILQKCFFQMINFLSSLSLQCIAIMQDWYVVIITSINSLTNSVSRFFRITIQGIRIAQAEMAENTQTSPRNIRISSNSYSIIQRNNQRR